MGGYINKISSLEDKASAQVAINLCQGNGFKEVALCLEKPTYGGFISGYAPSFFVSDPEKLSIWAKVKEDPRLCDVFERSCCLNNAEKAEQWDTAVEEQCQRQTGGTPLPNRLRKKIYPWINRVALEYLSYSRRQEILFGVSRYFLMDIFTRGDWKETARLDEEKLAQRLLEDERLTVLQKYRIACVYCLHVYIPQLWEKLTKEDKYGLSEETHGLVLLWTRYMNANQKWPKNDIWVNGAFQAISYGNRAALMVCWKELQEGIRRKTVIDRALESLRQWQSHGSGYYKWILVSKQPFDDSVKKFNASSYYSELMCFFLSQMNEQQQRTFFKKTFQSKYPNRKKSVLECFLDWPHQDDFLPTINRLWGIIPKDTYGQCLLALANKYRRNEEKANPSYDYRSLLRALWEETPEEYKQYVFCDRKTDYSVINEGKELLSRLLERSPFQEKDEVLFKQIFRDQPQEKRREMMLYNLYKWGENSKEGETMCSLLVQKEKWSFMNWLLEECLSKEEIPIFKKRFIESDCGVKLCLDALKENREKLVEDLLDWSSNSDAEKKQSKDALINRNASVDVCESLLRKGKFADVERVIHFCLSSDEKKERFKDLFAQRACGALLTNYTYDSWLEDCVWKQMDTIIAWSVDTEEKRRDFKKKLFSRKRIAIHYDLVFIKEVEVVRGKIERFYQWFELSPEEIKQLKRDTLFAWESPDVIQNIYESLPEYTNALVASLRWCLTDEEMVIDLKKAVEEEYFTEVKVDEVVDKRKTDKEVGLFEEVFEEECFTGVLDERKKKEKERLNDLISELLKGFKKEEVQDKTSEEGVLVKGIGEKRSSVGIEDESTSPRKRRK